MVTRYFMRKDKRRAAGLVAFMKLAENKTKISDVKTAENHVITVS